MGPEDFGETKKVNHTPTIALALAAVLLLIVGAMSWSDFQRKKLEKEFAEKESQMMQRFGYGNSMNPQQPMMQGQQPGYAPPGGYPGAVNGQGFQQQQAPVAPQQQPQQQFAQPSQPSPGLLQSAAEMQVESSLPRPVDPEIAQIQDSLDQARQQTQRTDQRYRDLTGDVDEKAMEAAEAERRGIGDLNTELPDFLKNAVENPPGGNPEVEERLARMREQVRNAPSLATVTSFDSEWGVVTFNAGSKQLVKPEQRFAVRRGTDILGWVKVDQVEENESIAVLVTKNRDSDTARKPEVGDDLIDFELF